MKREPRIQMIVERMGPGVLCRDGFLGGDGRRLEEILDADNSTVVGLGTTHVELAGKLEEVYERARAQLGRSVTVGEGITAVYGEAMGKIPCPWGGCGTFSKGQVELSDSASGTKSVCTSLGVHMIRKHGFYGGRGSMYRMGPREIQRLL